MPHVFARPVRRHRRLALEAVELEPARPDRALPLRRRHGASTRRSDLDALPRRLDARARRRAAATTGGRSRPRRARLGGEPRAVPGDALDGAGTARGSPCASRATSPTIAPGALAAGPRPASPARPAAAHVPRPLRHLHRLRPAAAPGGTGRRALTPSRRTAAGTSPAGCTGSATRCATARSSAGRAPARRPGAAHRREGGRVDRRAARRTARGCRPTSSSPTPTRRTSTARSSTPRARPGGWPARPRRCRASCCCSRSTDARRGWRTTTCCSPPTTTRSSTRSSATRRARSRTPRSTSARRTTRRVRPDGCEAWFVLVNAPRHGGAGRRRLARARARPLRRPPARPARRARAAGARPDAVVAGHHARRPRAAHRAVGGAIYGTSSNGAAAAFLRPANRSPVPGAVPGRRLRAPGRRSAPGHAVGADRRRAGRSGMTPERPRGGTLAP